MSTELKPGLLVRVLTDNGHHSKTAVILNHDGTPDYPHDYWIQFSDGSKAPYGDYELEVLTFETLQSEIDALKALQSALLGGAK
jgi:hypothetical protein